MIGKSKSIFCFFCILLAIFGCGSDEEEPVVEETPSEKIVGSWDLVTVNGKSLKADVQEDAENGWEVVEAGEKLVFAPDGSLFKEASIGMKLRVEDSSIVDGWLLDFTVRMYFKLTLNGTYVISDQTIEFISGVRVNVEFDFSIDDTANIPELENLEQEMKESLSESTQEFEQEFASEFELELDTHTFDFNGDRLTLVQGSERIVYRKR